MKNCPDIDKYDKNYDDLSESEVVELLNHAELCDYHNCQVSGYENSVMPVIDAYISNRSWIERGKQKITDYLKITPDITPENPPYPPSLIILFGRQITANLALSAAVVLLSTTLLFATIINNDKISKFLFAYNDPPKLTAGIDTSLSLTPKQKKEPLILEPINDTEALRNLVADLRKEVGELSTKIEKKNKNEFITEVSGYDTDKFKSVDNTTADSTDSNYESSLTNNGKDIKHPPPVQNNEQFVLTNTTKNNTKSVIQGIGVQTGNPNKVVMRHGGNNVVLSNWEMDPSKILGVDQSNETIEITFKLSENDNKARSIKAKIILDNRTYQIDLAKNISGSYTIPVLKGSKFLVILETESKLKVKEFYAVESKTFDFPDND